MLRATLPICLGLAAACSGLLAGVVRMEVAERSPVPGQAYERVSGRVYYAIDPAHPGNRGITDIDAAPRDQQGLVHFSADFYMLRPRRGNGTLLFEAVNRGSKRMLAFFNRAQSSEDPRQARDFGDGHLLRAGYTLVWIGWQHDVPRNPLLMRAYVPAAPGVSGKIRGEFTPDRPVTTLPLADSNHVPYRPLGNGGTLTVRDRIHGPRTQIPPTEWSFGQGGKTIELRSPTIPGRIYEFVYDAADPAIAGLGLAAVRDGVSFLKEEAGAKFAIAFGISQSAMMLRAFLYEGFNRGENGARVFDGVLAHVGGARRSTFQRFTQPSRTAGPLRNASLSPTEQFPFADGVQRDHLTGATDGLLVRAWRDGVAPKIFYTNTAYEYWGSGAALLHTSTDGKRDVPLPPDVRLYVFSGGQHGPSKFPPERSGARNLANFNDYRWSVRALLARLHAWVARGEEPPASVYPRLKDRTLVALRSYRFPKIEGVEVPSRIHTPAALDIRRDTGGTSHEPPRVLGRYVVTVPQADRDGNDLGGIRMPEVECPLASWTGWNLRAASLGGSGYLRGNLGSYLPFAADRQEIATRRDRRRSILERYADEDAYAACVEKAALGGVQAGYLLEQDIGPISDAARRHWRWRFAESELEDQSSTSIRTTSTQ